MRGLDQPIYICEVELHRIPYPSWINEYDVHLSTCKIHHLVDPFKSVSDHSIIISASPDLKYDIAASP
jgi:hypothetical protein